MDQNENFPLRIWMETANFVKTESRLLFHTIMLTP
jgi:hypothetical protein